MRISLIPFLFLLACSQSNQPDESNSLDDVNEKDINIIHHNAVFESQVANDLNEEGLTFAQKEDYVNARQKFQAALEFEENNPTILNNLGLTEKAVYNNEEAARYFERAILADSTYYNSHTNYGLLLYEMKEYKKSLEILNKAITHSNDQVILGSACLHAAYSYFELGDCKKAKAMFMKSKKYTRHTQGSAEQNKAFEAKLKTCR